MNSMSTEYLNAILNPYNYQITRYIHKGAWGRAYQGKNNTNNNLCIKVSVKHNINTIIGGLTPELLRNYNMIDNEYKIGKLLEPYNITPKIYENIHIENNDFLISEFYGHNLQQLLNIKYCITDKNKHRFKKIFEDNLIIILSYGIINILKYIHLSGIIYIDIHLGNFLLGCPINELTIDNVSEYLKIIDFGLSEILTEKRKQETKRVQLYKEKGKIEGNRFYASNEVFNGYAPWYKDDLISMILNMIYLKIGFLPYSITDRKQYNKQYNLKQLIIQSNMPDVFIDIYNEIESININRPLDYDKILIL